MKYITKQIRHNWHKAALALILALTGFLSFYSIGNEGYANQYYAAAVKSMLTSLHNFFFASFDPGGFVSVDKPALGLWLQALSVMAFGYHGWSLILPEALSAVLSTALLYHMARKFYGKAAGIASALIFALTPILIAVSRTNNFDSSLVLVLLLAAWALFKALKKGSFRFLLLSMCLVGLGFNIKMLQAFMVLPAFYLTYLLTAPLKMKKRILQLSGATAVLLAVSLSWAFAVDLTPAADRPYVGSSSTNSVIELALGYNGIQRITGRDGGSGGGGLTDGGRQGAFNDNGRMDGGVQPGIPDGGTPGIGRNDGTFQAPPADGDAQENSEGNPNGGRGFPGDGGNFGRGPGGQPGDGMNPGGGPGGTGENGTPGFFRIFNGQLAGQISWLLPLALCGLLILILKVCGCKKTERKDACKYLLLWGGWLFPALVFFSIAGFYHRYYLVMLAPAIAALGGAGLVEMHRAYIRNGWKWVVLPSAVLLTSIGQGVILSRYGELHFLTFIVCGICVLSIAALVVIRIVKRDNLRNTIKMISTAGFVGLLIAPAFWACTPLLYGSQTTLPIAGPELRNDGMGQPGGRFNNLSANVDFLLSKKQGEKYLVAVQDANSAAPIIIETGEPVLAIGGFSGSDRILTVERLEQMVKAGEVRYFEVSGRGMGQQSEIVDWVRGHGEAVSGTSLYDLAPEKDS